MAVMQIDINDTDIINNPQPKKKEEPKKEAPKVSNFFGNPQPQQPKPAATATTTDQKKSIKSTNFGNLFGTVKK